MYGSKDPTCPFFSVYSLAEILNAGNPDALVVSRHETDHVLLLWRFTHPRKQLSNVSNTR